MTWLMLLWTFWNWFSTPYEELSECILCGAPLLPKPCALKQKVCLMLMGPGGLLGRLSSFLERAGRRDRRVPYRFVAASLTNLQLLPASRPLLDVGAVLCFSTFPCLSNDKNHRVCSSSASLNAFWFLAWSKLGEDATQHD